jgi:hypothetical protein
LQLDRTSQRIDVLGVERPHVVPYTNAIERDG